MCICTVATLTHHPGMNINNFLLGIRYALSGITTYLTSPRLWLYAITPMILVLAVYSALAWWLLGSCLQSLSESLASCEYLPNWLGSCITPVAWLLAISLLLLILALFLGTLYEAVGGLFFSAMVRHFEHRRYGRPANPDISLFTDLRNTLSCVAYAFGTLLLSLPLYLLGFLFPVISQVLTVFLLGKRYGIGHCAEAAFNRGLSIKTLQWEFRGRSGILYGFGAVIFLLMLVPFVTIILVPGFVIGGTMLVNEQTSEIPPTKRIPAANRAQ